MPQDDVDNESDVASENEYETKEEQEEDAMPVNSTKIESRNGGDQRDVKKPKLDPKDPLRPRRKKARRACFACQRAHLTCGDERPCQRCIKRGLADQCQDGVRKKAKYLHDAPPEALRPVLGPNYNPGTNGRPTSQITNGSSASGSSPGVAGFFPQVTQNSPGFLQYQQMRQAQQMPPPMQEGMPFLSQQSPISPHFASNQQIQANLHGMPNAMGAPEMKIDPQNPYGGALFDPSNPALFNFDLEGLNFGNHYGAMEFSMLNHMSSGAAETPPQDQMGNVNFDANVYNAGHYGNLYQDGMVNDYGVTRQDSQGNIFTVNNTDLPRAYAIQAGPISNPSPSTDTHASPQSFIIDASPKQTFSATNSTSQQMTRQSHPHNNKVLIQPQKAAPKFPSMAPTKRNRDTSSIYSSVTEPYSYTTGFHALTAFVQRRFSATATLKIAKSLASIRPSFISCTKTLNREDLIFMEKCFQRTLFEYEDFMRDCSTPTLVCRRSGEVAAVNKEFTFLTGWSKNVLLGREPNLNINTGQNSARTSVNSTGRAGLTTPRMRSLGLEQKGSNRPTYVLLAELLDDDSVIEFYEDFAKLAFGDSRGSVTKRCKLLKYRAKDLNDSTESSAEEKDKLTKRDGAKELERKREQQGYLYGKVSKIDGEFGIGRLEKDGKLDCSYCWTVKRDVFDIPMLIVMNFLPCI